MTSFDQWVANGCVGLYDPPMHSGQATMINRGVLHLPELDIDAARASLRAAGGPVLINPPTYLTMSKADAALMQYKQRMRTYRKTSRAHGRRHVR